MNIVSILLQQAQATPDTPAIIDTANGRSRVTTFKEIDERSRKVAAFLSKRGLGAGDTALVFYPMSADLYITLLAVFRLGMVAMFLDPSAGRRHMDECCSIKLPQALIASPKAHLLRLVSPALRRIPKKFVIGARVPGAVSLAGAEGLNPYDDLCDADEGTPALLTFTSGSTGKPKAAMRSHGFLLAQHRVLEQTLQLEPGDVDLATLPIFVLANLASGVTSLIPDADLRAPAAIDAGSVVRQIDAVEPKSTGASPAFLERLADFCEAKGRHLPSFEKIFCGGAPVFPPLLEKLARVAPQAKRVAVYGSTEAEPIAEIAHQDIDDDDMNGMMNGKGLLAGQPVTAIELRIMREGWKPGPPATDVSTFEGQCAHQGEAGEIVVTGGHVLKGYLNGAGDEETKFRVDSEVWHRTGDSGYLDDRDRLWLLGRTSAAIHDERGGLHPFAIESAALMLPGIRRAALVNQSDSGRLLVIESTNQRTELNLASIRESLAWAHLAEVRQIPHIPVDKRHNAKVDYPALSKLLTKK